MRPRIILLALAWCIVPLTLLLGQVERDDSILRFGMNLPNNMTICEEAGVELVKKFPIDWMWIEPFAPSSERKQIKEYAFVDLGLSDMPRDVQKRIEKRVWKRMQQQDLTKVTIDHRQDSRGRWHMFNWTFLDQYVRSVHAQDMDVMFGLTFNSYWASERQALAIRDRKDAGGYNAPLRDPLFAADVEFYVTTLVERYDGDGVNDMPGLSRRVVFWEDGNEFNVGRFWSGTNEQYLALWKAFSNGVRSADPTAKVICNGLANVHEIKQSSTRDGGFSTVRAFKSIAKGSRFEKLLGSEVATRMRRQLDAWDRDNRGRRTEDLLALLGDQGVGPDGQKRAAEAIAATKRSFEFMQMQLENPQLYDVFVPHFYNFYRYDPSLIPDCMEYIRQAMLRHGVTKPIMVMEASGAHLGTSGRYAEAAQTLHVLKKESHRDHVQTKHWYRAEQSMELIKVHAALFAEGVSCVVWFKMEDIVGGAWQDSAYSVQGLLEAGPKSKKKPAFFAYRQMTTLLKGFSSAEWVGEHQVVFHFDATSPVVVAWTEQGNQTLDLSSHFSFDRVKVIPVVTELDDRGHPIVHRAASVSAASVPVTSRPVFVTEL